MALAQFVGSAVLVAQKTVSGFIISEPLGLAVPFQEASGAERDVGDNGVGG